MCAVSARVRHCVECPKCLTRYLVGFSPYRNGSYLMPVARGICEEWILYCACRTPHAVSRWGWKELKLYEVPVDAHQSGFGSPEQMPIIRRSSGFSP
jgi:hypothetical protein